ncbi:MAG: FAD-binding oxidoreductase [Alphaproteobacteria bacterium]
MRPRRGASRPTAATAAITIVEAEAQPGYHSTGRSAAMYLESYGPQPINALTGASRAFFMAPPPGFAEVPLLTPRPVMLVAAPGDEALLEAELSRHPMLSAIGVAAARAMVPLLRPAALTRAAMENDAMAMDVAAIHQGYLRGFRALGGRIVTDARVRALTRRADGWRIETPAGDFAADIVVDAAGAWADRVAALAGARPRGLQPKRRTAVIVPAPAGHDVRRWPLVSDVAETYYFRAEVGDLLVSPADQTPVEPCDAQPDEIDVAVAVDRLEHALDIAVRRVLHKWAGLRSFVGDGNPVVGWDGAVDGFFWLAGQGGYGIQSAPGMADYVAALLAGRPNPIPALDPATVAATRTITATKGKEHP